MNYSIKNIKCGSFINDDILESNAHLGISSNYTLTVLYELNYNYFGLDYGIVTKLPNTGYNPTPAGVKDILCNDLISQNNPELYSDSSFGIDDNVNLSIQYYHYYNIYNPTPAGVKDILCNDLISQNNPELYSDSSFGIDGISYIYIYIDPDYNKYDLQLNSNSDINCGDVVPIISNVATAEFGISYLVYPTVNYFSNYNRIDYAQCINGVIDINCGDVVSSSCDSYPPIVSDAEFGIIPEIPYFDVVYPPIESFSYFGSYGDGEVGSFNFYYPEPLEWGIDLFAGLSHTVEYYAYDCNFGIVLTDSYIEICHNDTVEFPYHWHTDSYVCPQSIWGINLEVIDPTIDVEPIEWGIADDNIVNWIFFDSDEQFGIKFDAKTNLPLIHYHCPTYLVPSATNLYHEHGILLKTDCVVYNAYIGWDIEGEVDTFGLIGDGEAGIRFQAYLSFDDAIKGRCVWGIVSKDITTIANAGLGIYFNAELPPIIALSELGTNGVAEFTEKRGYIVWRTDGCLVNDYVHRDEFNNKLNERGKSAYWYNHYHEPVPVEEEKYLTQIIAECVYDE